MLCRGHRGDAEASQKHNTEKTQRVCFECVHQKSFQREPKGCLNQGCPESSLLSESPASESLLSESLSSESLLSESLSSESLTSESLALEISVSGRVPVRVFPTFGIPVFGIPDFGIPDFGIPAFGIPGFGILDSLQNSPQKRLESMLMQLSC